MRELPRASAAVEQSELNFRELSKFVYTESLDNITNAILAAIDKGDTSCSVELPNIKPDVTKKYYPWPNYEHKLLLSLEDYLRELGYDVGYRCSKYEKDKYGCDTNVPTYNACALFSVHWYKKSPASVVTSSVILPHNNQYGNSITFTNG